MFFTLRAIEFKFSKLYSCDSAVRSYVLELSVQNWDVVLILPSNAVKHSVSLANTFPYFNAILWISLLLHWRIVALINGEMVSESVFNSDGAQRGREDEIAYSQLEQCGDTFVMDHSSIDWFLSIFDRLIYAARRTLAENSWLDSSPFYPPHGVKAGGIWSQCSNLKVRSKCGGEGFQLVYSTSFAYGYYTAMNTAAIQFFKNIFFIRQKL